MTSAIAGMRILLVEDEAIIAMMAEDMLEALECVVVATAPTVAEALHQVGTASFDAAMLDLNLAGEASDPIAFALRDASKPFIFTTGYGSAGRLTGFAHIPLVTKPYSAPQIEAALSKAWRTSQGP